MIDIARGQELLLKQVGKRYVFGWEVKLKDSNPKAFDCSELVQWFFYQFRISVPDGSANQYNFSQPVVDRRPFDVGFLRKSQGAVFHVVIRYDKNWIINAKGQAWGVVKGNVLRFEGNSSFAGWRRFPELSRQRTMGNEVIDHAMA